MPPHPEPTPIPPTVAVPIAAWDFATGSRAPTVLAVGDFTANGLWFGDLARASDGHLHIVAPDLRGRAASRGAPAARSTLDHVHDLTALVEQRALTAVTVLGHGTGAQVALDLAAARPSLFTGVVTVDGPAIWPMGAHDPVDAAAHLDPGATRIGRTWAHRDAVFHEGIVSGRLPRAGMSRALRRAADAETTGVGFGWQARLAADALEADARNLATWAPPSPSPRPVHIVRARHGHRREDPPIELWDLGAPVTTVDTTHTGLLTESDAVHELADLLTRLIVATIGPGPGTTRPNCR